MEQEGTQGLHVPGWEMTQRGAMVTPGGVAQLERSPRSPRHPGVPWPSSSSNPRSWPSWEVSTHYRGPELYNYHGRLSYFGKRLCCCQSFYSSKPKQDGKSPAQDAASGRHGELNLLTACTRRHPPPRQGLELGLPRRVQRRVGGKIWGHRDHSGPARHGMGLGVSPVLSC